MSSLRIEEVKGWGGKGKFINFPWRLPAYLSDRNWVPPLKIENRMRMSERLNPFFKHARVKYFMAYRSGEPVGGPVVVGRGGGHDAQHDGGGGERQAG